MFCLPKLRFAVFRPLHGAFRNESDPITPDTVDFKMMGMVSGRIFYECERCGMCGCPSFEYHNRGVPEDIFEHLQWHAQVCAILAISAARV